MRRRRLPSLLVRFGALSTFVVLLLAVVLDRTLVAGIEHRALSEAETRAEVIAAAGIEEHISDRDLRGMTPAQLDELDRLMRTKRLLATGIRRMKVFNAEPRIVYSDDRRAIGKSAARSDYVRRALRGQVGSKLTVGTDHSGRGERMLEVFVPLVHHEQPGEVPVGVFEVYLPYAPVAAAVAADTRRLRVAMGLGLLVLWLALFRIVSGASRTLRRQAAESHLQARRDALTGLGNRRALFEQGAGCLARLADDERAALLLVDLDHFKEVNDTLGHDQGDRLLQCVAERLRAALRPADVLARLGGDEFAILLADAPSEAAIRQRTGQLRATLSEPVELASLAVRVDGSIGVALYPEHGDTVEALLKHADVAMYQAKGTAERTCFYEPEADPYSHRRLSLAAELNDAIDRGELVVHYQPIIDARDGTVRGAEALVRWNHPEEGLLPPAAFLPVAERTGAIVPLTTFVIEQTLSDLHRWQEAGLDLEVACNLSSANASDFRLPDVVAAALERWPVDPRRLTLELSEDTVISDAHRVGEVLRRLHALGVRLSLDDFGTGNSSLAHLRHLPLDQLKIDRSFVSELCSVDEDRAVVDAILAMGGSLGLETVAEGVEDAPTAAALTARGCDRLQGFHFSRPVPREEFERQLEAPAEHAA